MLRDPAVVEQIQTCAALLQLQPPRVRVEGAESPLAVYDKNSSDTETEEVLLPEPQLITEVAIASYLQQGHNLLLLDLLIHEQAEIWYWYQWMQTTVWGDAATRNKVYTGATQFTRMPRGPSSCARPRERASRAAFDAPIKV